jgi:3-oxosteroid 1-dehydrogenase
VGIAFTRSQVVEEFDMRPWDETVDWLVVGSGGGGMTAAIRAHDLGGASLIIEKADVYGGSTALSGGVVWVPNNPLMRQAGMADSAEEGLQYLETVTAGTSTSERLRAFVETAPRMMTYLAQHTHVVFETIPDYPDYYPEEAGGKRGGRSCEPVLFNALELGEELARLRMYAHEDYIMGFLTCTAAEGKPLMKGDRKAGWIMLKKLCAYAFNLRARLRGKRNTDLTLGVALISRARRSLMDRGVPLWLNTKLEDLVVEEGRVVGAVVTREGETLRIRAHRGVLLAAGGFERNQELRKRYQQAPIATEWTAGAATNTGDTLAIGERVGADVDLLDDAWWCPVFDVPGRDYGLVVIYEKNLPGGIIVNKLGERFMNEAAPYNDVVKRMYAANSPDAACIPAYLIFDGGFRRKYPVGPVFPSSWRPDWTTPKKLAGFMQKDATLEGLAGQLGIDPRGLVRTVERFNEFARAGQDADFGRGESAQDRYYTVLAEGPNPNLAEIKEPPFYALEVWPGDLGTKGGLVTDAKARVVNNAGEVIPGLYATGNCSAVTMGRTYPGAGGTIGPAMTFGFIAAEHAIAETP